MHGVEKIPDNMCVAFNRKQMRNLDYLFVPAPTSIKFLKGTLKVFGVIGIFMTAQGIKDNYRDYGFKEATVRSLIDLAAVGISVPGGPVGGVAGNYGAELLKDYLFKKE